MSSAAGLAIALLGPPVPGLLAARLLRLRGALLLPAAWLFGCALIVVGMVALSAIHLHYSRASLSILWLLLVASLLLLQRFIRSSDRYAQRSEPRVSREKPVTFGVPAGTPGAFDAVSILLVTVCCFQLAYVALQALRVPLGSFDSWSLWEFKGRLAWLAGGLTGPGPLDHAAIFAHPAYPPLVPLLIAWIYTWCGSADPVLMKPLFPCFFAALLLAFYCCLTPRIGHRGALLATAALALVPRVVEYAGTGLADVPLCAYLVCAAACFVAGGQGKVRASLLATGLLLGFAMDTKRDGLVFAACAVLGLLLLTRSWRQMLQLLAPLLVSGLPWYLYVWLAHLPDRDFLPFTLHNITSHLDRFGPLARLFSLNLLALDEWSALWYAFAIALLVGCLRGRVRAGVLLLFILVPLCTYVFSLTLSAWQPYDKHARTSLDRLIMVTAPFALWFVVEQLFHPARGGAAESADE